MVFVFIVIETETQKVKIYEYNIAQKKIELKQLKNRLKWDTEFRNALDHLIK